MAAFPGRFIIGFILNADIVGDQESIRIFREGFRALPSEVALICLKNRQDADGIFYFRIVYS